LYAAKKKEHAVSDRCSRVRLGYMRSYVDRILKKIVLILKLVFCCLDRNGRREENMIREHASFLLLKNLVLGSGDSNMVSFQLHGSN
jgi:hypothetical protein